MQFGEILGRFTDVSEEQDGGYLALCPAHGDSRPSLRIWRGEDNKVRMTCRVGCKTEDVIAAVGLTWADMFNATGESLTVPAERAQLVSGAYVAQLAAYAEGASLALFDYGNTLAAQARGYMLRRFGLDDDSAAELGLGVDHAGTFPYTSRAYRTYPRLTVPLRGFDGQPRGLQGRDLSGDCPGRWVSLMNPEGFRWAPYGVFRGQGGYGVVLVTEGPGDALTAVSCGYDAVAIRGASLATSPELIAELAAGLRGSQVIICGDNDTAGNGFTKRLADGLAALGVSVATLEIPYAGADLTDWRERVGPRAFPALLHEAVKGAQTLPGAHGLAVPDGDTGALIPDADEARRAVRLVTDLMERYGSSDVLNAHALVTFTGGRIKFAEGLGFYVWNGTIWERSATRVRQAIHYMGAAITVAAAEKTEEHKARGGAKDDESDPGKSLRAISKGFTVSRNIDSLMRELKAVPSVAVEASALDAREDLLTFRNGTVNLRTGILREHSKADMLTYAQDMDYNPDAKCPRWEQFLAEIFPEYPELVDYFRRLVGYGITGSVAEQCFAVLWGKGANGKSVATDTITSVFRPISKTTPFATFEEKASGGIPNDLAALRDARLVMASEGESGKPMSEAVLKRVTGKDEIAARFLRQEFFTFKPTFLLMLATNHKPKFRGQDEGLWRRVKMIPFKRWFAPHERDYTLDAKLLAESEGIAAWAVRGAVEWFAGGLQDPDIIAESTKEYRETSDALAGFFPGVLEPCEEGEAIDGAAAFNSYLEWCEAENLPTKERWTRRAFYGAMEERGVTRRKRAQGIVLIGCRMVPTGTKATGPGIFNRDAE